MPDYIHQVEYYDKSKESFLLVKKESKIKLKTEEIKNNYNEIIIPKNLKIKRASSYYILLISLDYNANIHLKNKSRSSIELTAVDTDKNWPIYMLINFLITRLKKCLIYIRVIHGT